jgi:hypothetical protein
MGPRWSRRPASARRSANISASNQRWRTISSTRGSLVRITLTGSSGITILRNQPNQADIQVNLLPLADRSTQSHQIAKRLRPELQKIGLPYGARIKVSEVPPGPPVVQTLVAEVYGPDAAGQIQRREDRSSRSSSKRRTLSTWIGTSKIRRRNTGLRS